MPTQPTLLIEFAPDDDPLNAGPTWIDITADVLRIPSVKRGRSQEGGRFESGTATIVLDNSQGTYTNFNASSTYAGRLRPMCQIRIQATWSAVTYPIFRGFVERWQPTWPGGFDSEMQLDCVDGFKIFATQKITDTTGNDDSRIEVGWALGLAGWPAGMRDLSASSWVVIGSVTLTQQPILTYLQDLMMTEGGEMWIAADGDFTWRWRNARYADTRSRTIQASFGYDPSPTHYWLLGNATDSVLGSTTIPRSAWPLTAATTELPYLTIITSYDDQFIINDAQVTTNASVLYTASDLVSQARYGVRTYTLSVLTASGTDAQERADLFVARYKDPQFRILQVSFSGHQGDDAWPVMLGLDINDRVSVVLRPGNSTSFGQEGIIEALDQQIGDDTWTMTLTVSPAVYGI